MNKISFNILRIGLAITFLWIGFMIWQDPEAWGSYLMPWAVKLLPAPIKEVMIATAVADMAIGVLFLINRFVWFAALAATVHLIVVIVTSGINEGTVRDIGILAASTALGLEALPESISGKFKFFVLK